jgi:hypothetical protein
MKIGFGPKFRTLMQRKQQFTAAFEYQINGVVKPTVALVVARVCSLAHTAELSLVADAPEAS